MTALAILYIIDTVLLSTSATRVTPCGMFKFHSPQSNNNTFIVQENTSVNITFTLLNLNCSKMYSGSIGISKKDQKTGIFGRQCVIFETCKSGPFHNNTSCQCLGEHGLYSFSFIATRHDSTLWKWSTANRMSSDAIIEIIVICGMFKFHSPQSNNNTFIVKENTSVNITFTLLNLNCSNMSSGSIDIYQKDLKTVMFGRQCVIYETCKSRPFHNNRSCQCLGEHGLYSFSFIATRHDSTLWKWSTANRMSSDAIIEIIVIYPPRVITMGKTGNDRPIPRHRSVLIYCSWENSNPPSDVRLLDRQGNVLASGNISGNISYTFQAVDCNNTGTIHCVANGAQENITLLVECPPEILIPPPKIRNISAEKNAVITFPFRSHEPDVTACHFTLLKGNKTSHNISINGTSSFTCINLSAHFTSKRKHCNYFVIGIPPDLQLILHLYNLKTEDAGLWYVNVSNNKGSDGMYIQVDIYNEDNMFSESRNEGKSLDYNQSTFNVDVVGNAEQQQMTNSLLLPLTGVVATLLTAILIYKGISFSQRVCTQRCFRQNKVADDLSVNEMYMEISNTTVSASLMLAGNESSDTDFAGTRPSQRDISVLKDIPLRTLLPIRTISLPELDGINVFVNSIPQSE